MLTEKGQKLAQCLRSQIRSVFSPYHGNDLLKKEVSELFQSQMEENEILPILKNYFQMAIERTPPDPILLSPMKELKFQTVHNLFIDNYMKKIPNLSSVFIEVEAGLYSQFYHKMESIYERLQHPGISLEEKMNCRSRLKNVFKKISNMSLTFPMMRLLI